MTTTMTRRRTAARTTVGATLATALTAAALTTVAATTAQAAPAGCSADYEVTSAWPGGFTANVTVTNLGDPLDGWTTQWQFTGGQTVNNLWNGVVSQSGNTVSVRDAGYNAALGTGQAASFGFVGAGAAENAVGAVQLNGVACSGDVVDPGPQPDPDPDPDPQPDPDPEPNPDPGPDPEPNPDPTPGPGPSGDFYVDTQTQAYLAAANATGETRRLLEKISNTPQAYWVGEWDAGSAAGAGVADYTQRASQAGATGILAIYAIPGRDCGSYSGGGVAESEYAAWVDQVSASIVGNPIVVLEPDALAQLGDCDGQGDRVGFLKYAAQSLSQAGARVYLDIGHSGWLAPDEAARRLNLIGFEHAHGFALNTSNYQTTAAETAYGNQISALVGGRGFVIDTSRNGNGSDGTWCNPRDRALGEQPRLGNDGNLDALLWVKLPGESDGTCNGGPAAGQWWQEIALEMARNASW